MATNEFVLGGEIMTIEEEYRVLNAELTQLFKDRNYEDFNKKRGRVCELFTQLDNPFEVGQEVEYLLGRRWVCTTITEIRSNSEVVTPIVIAPFTSFKVIEVERSLVEQEQALEPQAEQLKLF